MSRRAVRSRFTVLAVLMSGMLSIGAVVALPSAAEAACPAAEGRTVVVDMPAPGHATSFTLSGSCAPRAAETTATVIEVSGAGVEGSHPLVFDVRDLGGASRASGVRGEDLRGRSWMLGASDAGAQTGLVLTATLPPEAGNEYQGASATVSVRFASIEPVRSPGALAVTGAGGVLGLLVLAVILLAGGLLIVLHRRRRKIDDGEELA